MRGCSSASLRAGERQFKSDSCSCIREKRNVVVAMRGTDIVPLREGEREARSFARSLAFFISSSSRPPSSPRPIALHPSVRFVFTGPYLAVRASGKLGTGLRRTVGGIYLHLLEVESRCGKIALPLLLLLFSKCVFFSSRHRYLHSSGSFFIAGFLLVGALASGGERSALDETDRRRQQRAYRAERRMRNSSGAGEGISARLSGRTAAGEEIYSKTIITKFVLI